MVFVNLRRVVSLVGQNCFMVCSSSRLMCSDRLLLESFAQSFEGGVVPDIPAFGEMMKKDMLPAELNTQAEGGHSQLIPIFKDLQELCVSVNTSGSDLSTALNRLDRLEHTDAYRNRAQFLRKYVDLVYVQIAVEAIQRGVSCVSAKKDCLAIVKKAVCMPGTETMIPHLKPLLMSMVYKNVKILKLMNYPLLVQFSFLDQLLAYKGGDQRLNLALGVIYLQLRCSRDASKYNIIEAYNVIGDGDRTAYKQAQDPKALAIIEEYEASEHKEVYLGALVPDLPAELLEMIYFFAI